MMMTAAILASWSLSWWDPRTGERTPAAEALSRLEAGDVVVLGEDHYDETITAAQAAIVRHLQPATLGWEFLSTKDRAEIDAAYDAYREPGASTEALLAALFPAGAPPLAYAPLLEGLRDAGGRLVPTNLSREQKQPVTRGGLGAADPALVPEGFELGGELYRERFAEAMGGHPLPFPLENYFASQSLTDDVMAVSLLQAGGDSDSAGAKVLVTGSFHGDYRDGVVARIEARAPDAHVVYVKILNAAAYTASELSEMFVSPRYGPIADLVHVVGEPRADEVVE